MFGGGGTRSLYVKNASRTRQGHVKDTSRTSPYWFKGQHLIPIVSFWCRMTLFTMFTMSYDINRVSNIKLTFSSMKQREDYKVSSGLYRRGRCNHNQSLRTYSLYYTHVRIHSIHT